MARSSRFRLFVWIILVCCITSSCSAASERVFVAREGKGYLERVGSQLVLHLKGTPEEMGRQHGVLLKDYVVQNLRTLEQKAVDSMGQAAGFGNAAFDLVWNRQLKYMPERYVAELHALADGSGVPFDRIRRANTIPEFFHCSGFAVFGKATKGGTLYHGRVLDYGVDMGLQDHAVVIIAEPAGQIPFVSVTYAGFIGSVTGMNLKGVGFGEMGGGGVGHWDGLPMAFLMRKGMEEAGTLAQAKDIFSNNKRTCEYFYVISDSKGPDAVGVSATPEKIEFLGPNQAREPINVPIQDAVVLSRDDRYKLLTNRIKEKWGKIGSSDCLDLMRRPVAMTSNLHCVLMAPGTREMWVAHATSKGEPASEQPYTYLNITELMAKEPKPGP